ncbi:MAG: tyrosine-type recombinase/integrase [Candidatus Sedimenticola sp. (ex Thyasira tokunagai)]
MPTLLPLWRAARTTGKQCGLTATGDYQPSLRSPWLAAIDGERCLLRIEQGKGARDRLLPLGPTLLYQLRDYWQLCHPRTWLFPSRTMDIPLSENSIQKAFKRAKRQAGVEKMGGIHGLRHAYATHQLEAGIQIHRLQHLLGHQDLHSTLRYVHWVPSYKEGSGAHDLVAGLEVDHD